MAPRWVVRLLGVVAASDAQDDVIGDLQELHGRRVARLGRGFATVVTAIEGCHLILTHVVRYGWTLIFGGNRWVSAVEVRLALRLVRKQPFMTLSAVVALGVGIGMVAGAFSVFQQALYSDLPFPNGDRWVVVETYSGESGASAPLDLERLSLFRDAAPALAYIAGTESAAFNVVLAGGEVERVSGARVTPGVFGHLPYVPVLGRVLIPADGAPDAPPVALIRESFWERRFERAPSVLGVPLDVGGQPYLIVGVLPDDAGYPSDGEIWIPMLEKTLGATDDRAPVGSRQIAVLAEGATLDQAETQLRQLSSRVAAPGRGAAAQRHRVTPITRTMLSPQIQVGIAVAMTILLLVLLIIAANVANLIVARTARRTAELAVRTALGASRSRLVGQLFIEVLVIGGLASIMGLLTAHSVLVLYDRVLDEMPFWIHLRLEPTTAVVVVVLALLVSGVTGVLPGLRATRANPADSLRRTGGGSSLGVGRLGGAMIAAEVALSVALLGIALLFARGFQLYVTPEFDLPDDRVLTAQLYMEVPEIELVEGGAATVADSVQSVLFKLGQSIASVPGVTAVGFASHLPRVTPSLEALEVEGRADLVATRVVYLGPGLLEVLEVTPVLGRGVEDADLVPSAYPVVLVNEAFATENYGTTQVLGRRVRLSPAGGQDEVVPWREIVGVVPNVMEVTSSSSAAGVYHPMEPRRFTAVAFRVESDPLSFAGPLRRAAYDLDPNLNISDIVRLGDVGAENRTALAVMSSALTGIGVMTLLLSLAGVYSIVSLAVTQRTREIGVRVALGALPSSILWSVLRRSGLLVLGGAVLGALAGNQASKVRLFVFAVPDGSWWLFGGLVALMGVAGLIACWIPARRAVAIQPVEALRWDS